MGVCPGIGVGWAPLVWVLLGLFLSPVLMGASFTATVDRNATGVGEPVVLRLAFEGISPPGVPELTLPDGLRAQFNGSSREFSFVNGRSSTTLVYNYSVVALKPGDYTIPGFAYEVEGQRLASQPISLRVMKGDETGGGGDPLRRFGFVRMVVPKSEVYVGEVIPFEVQLYVQGAEDLQMPQIAADGFILGKLTKPAQSRTQVNGILYTVLIFKAAATAIREGNLNLGPAECTLVLRIPAGRTQRRDPNDPFGGDPFDFFGERFRRQPATLKSDPVVLKVRPLPAEGRPGSFAGAVGVFGMVATGGPAQVALGDPVTLKVQISGRGNLEAVSYPVQPPAVWKGFKLYPATANLQTSDELGVEGVKSFEQVVAPEEADVRAVPPLEFAYFDPGERRYKVLRSPEVALSVQTGSRTTAPEPSVTLASSAGREAAASAGRRELVHIKPRLGPVLAHAAGADWVGRPVWWLVEWLPLGLWLGAWGWRRWQDSLAADPRRVRLIETRRRVRDGLRALSGLAGSGDASAFFAAVFRLLQDQLGAVLDLPSAAITEVVVEERLRKGGVPPSLCDELSALFELCNQARYAPRQDPAELGAVAARATRALESLQSQEVER